MTQFTGDLATRLFMLLFLSVTPAMAQTPFKYSVIADTITILHYLGHNNVVAIPKRIASMPVTDIGKSAFQMNTNLTAVTIPESVTVIEEGAFAYCRHLKNLAIPKSVTKIGECAFSDCSDLTSVTIPGNVTNIGVEAFGLCQNMKKIVADKNNPAYSSINGVLFNKNRTQLIQCPAGMSGDYTIPDGVTSIGFGSFEGCRLTRIAIPNITTMIEDQAFMYCSNLTSVAIPNSVGADAFQGCVGLTNVILSPGVRSIGEFAFYSCPGLTTVTIPDSVTNIGTSAFYGSGVTNPVLPRNVKYVIEDPSVP